MNPYASSSAGVTAQRSDGWTFSAWMCGLGVSEGVSPVTLYSCSGKSRGEA